MKRFFCFVFVATCFAFVSCNTSDDNNTEVVEEREDRAAEAADEMEDAAEEYDTTSVQLEQ